MQAPKRFKKRSSTFDLNATSIDEASEWLVENLEEADADKSDRLRMRLLFEEALLNIADHFGEEQQVTATIERRNGRYRLRLETKGERFNPLKPETENEQDEWSMSLFSVIDLHVQYTYSVDANVLRISLPRPSMNPVLKIIIAILAGAVVGVAGNMLIPNSLQESFSNAVLQPFADMWLRLLQTISSPIIFLTALTATFGTKRIAEFGGSRLSTFARYFTISLLVVLFALVCCRPFFPLDVAATQANGRIVSGALDEVLKVVPDSLIDPFITGNTPQLLLIAIATGYVLASMESKLRELKAIVQQLNVLGLTIAKHACSLVPFFVGLLLCLKMWTHDTKLLVAIWAPLVISTVISIIVLAATTFIVSARFRVNPLVLAKKLRGPFVDALKRGTLDFSAVDDLALSCKRLLGINGEFARAILPQGLFLYMPTSGVGIFVFVMFAAIAQRIDVDQMWLVAAVALSVILAVATPPMTGANLLSFIMVFSYLGISNDLLLEVMVFDIVFGVLCIAFDQTMLQLETIHQAKQMGFLDEKVLQEPMQR